MAPSDDLELVEVRQILPLTLKWSDTPVLPRATPDPKSGGFDGPLASDIKMAPLHGLAP